MAYVVVIDVLEEPPRDTYRVGIISGTPVQGYVPAPRVGCRSSWSGERRPRLPGLARAVRRPGLEPAAPHRPRARGVPPHRSRPTCRWWPPMPAARRPTWVSPRCPPMWCSWWACSATSATPTSPPRGRHASPVCVGGHAVVEPRPKPRGRRRLRPPVREVFAAAGFTEVSIRAFDDQDDRTAGGRSPRRSADAAGAETDVVHLRGLSLTRGRVLLRALREGATRTVLSP
jgi:hypothetical protein